MRLELLPDRDTASPEQETALNIIIFPSHDEIALRSVPTVIQEVPVQIIPGTVPEIIQSLEDILSYFQVGPSFLVGDTNFDSTYFPLLDALASRGESASVKHYMQSYKDAFEFVSLLNMEHPLFGKLAAEAKQWGGVAGPEWLYARKMLHQDYPFLHQDARQNSHFNYTPTATRVPYTGRRTRPHLPSLERLTALLPQPHYVYEDPESIAKEGNDLSYPTKRALNFITASQKRYDDMKVHVMERPDTQDTVVALRLPVPASISDVTPHSHYWRTFVTSEKGPYRTMVIMREIESLHLSVPVLESEPKVFDSISWDTQNTPHHYAKVEYTVSFLGQEKTVSTHFPIDDERYRLWKREAFDRADTFAQVLKVHAGNLTRVHEIYEHLPSFL